MSKSPKTTGIAEQVYERLTIAALIRGPSLLQSVLWAKGLGYVRSRQRSCPSSLPEGGAVDPVFRLELVVVFATE